MRNLLKKGLCVLSAVIMLVTLFSITAFAAPSTTIAFSSNSVKPGDSVTVTVRLNAGTDIYGVNTTVTFDPNVLQYVSGAGSASGGTLKIVESPSGGSTFTVNIKFKALKEGNCTIAAYSKYSGIDLIEKDGGSAGAVLSVKTPATSSNTPQSSSKPSSSQNNTTTVSSNANLSNITLSGGALSPAFSKNVTEYTVSVDNSVAKTTITATPAHNKAVVLGAGDIDLAVGDNKLSISVTAPDGKTKKTYNITIHRATLEESLGLNPTATIINGKLHYITKDLSALPVPAGFSLQTVTYNGVDVNVFKSDSADYTLFQITDSETSASDYYIYKELRDEFVPLNYITINNNLVILSDLPEDYAVPEGYYETAVTLGDKEIRAFCSNDERLSDFYIIYCYVNGAEQFCSFDMKESTLQRAPDFQLGDAQIPSDDGREGLLEWFASLDGFTKILIYVILVESVVVIVLFILVLVVGRKRKAYDDDDDNNNIIIDDSDMSEFFERVAPRHSAEDEE